MADQVSQIARLHEWCAPLARFTEAFRSRPDTTGRYLAGALVWGPLLAGAAPASVQPGVRGLSNATAHRPPRSTSSVHLRAEIRPWSGCRTVRPEWWGSARSDLNSRDPFIVFHASHDMAAVLVLFRSPGSGRSVLGSVASSPWRASWGSFFSLGGVWETFLGATVSAGVCSRGFAYRGTLFVRRQIAYGPAKLAIVVSAP